MLSVSVSIPSSATTSSESTTAAKTAMAGCSASTSRLTTGSLEINNGSQDGNGGDGGFPGGGWPRRRQRFFRLPRFRHQCPVGQHFRSRLDNGGQDGNGGYGGNGGFAGGVTAVRRQWRRGRRRYQCSDRQQCPRSLQSERQRQWRRGRRRRFWADVTVRGGMAERAATVSMFRSATMPSEPSIEAATAVAARAATAVT